VSIQDLTPPPRARTLGALLVCAAAVLPYLPTIDDYFVRDDFGVVQLLASKPASYFPRWFTTSWMDEIWGFVPDEVRPFPALSYQLTALGGAASPELHHIVNILIHAVNGLLVMGVARIAASLSLKAATFAGLIFVLLPVHTESVAWITGRVDSMPAMFYLASFLLYARWRRRGSAEPSLYVWSVVIFFAALFTKQNTITMVGTLAAYDVLVQRRPFRPIARFVTPYVPFALLTVGYLWLRYELFGEIAREGSLSAQQFADFRVLVVRHLIHTVTGKFHGSPFVLSLGIVLVAAGWLVSRRQQQTSAGTRMSPRTFWYFGPVWWIIGVGPVLVAGYSSPRHVYLAAVGWAIALGAALDAARAARSSRRWTRACVTAAVVVAALYLLPLYRAVRDSNITADVSHKVVRDVRAAALASPEGSLVIVGAPTRSWAWALPFAVRPPFVRVDLTDRVFIVSPLALSCCSRQWFDETRRTLRDWSTGSRPDAAVALHWDDYGALARADSASSPQLPVLARSLLDLERADDLNKNLERILDELPAPSR
jgi:hypothetical protein